VLGGAAGAVQCLRRRRGCGWRLASGRPRPSAAGFDGRLRWRRTGPPRHREQPYLPAASAAARAVPVLHVWRRADACLCRPTMPMVSWPRTTRCRPDRPPRLAQRARPVPRLCGRWCGWRRAVFAAVEGLCTATRLRSPPTLSCRIAAVITVAARLRKYTSSKDTATIAPQTQCSSLRCGAGDVSLCRRLGPHR
jgi:hypothetical protein